MLYEVITDLLKTHRREVNVVFLDLRGFTAFIDSAEPEEVMELLREYHAAMGKLVLAHGGTLERFAGDGMIRITSYNVCYTKLLRVPGESIEIVTRGHPDALALLRHDAAHVMAEAVQELYPGTRNNFV